MNFICKKCKSNITYPSLDESFYKSLNWVCMNCYIILSHGNYNKNIKKGVTVFSPMGEKLGDAIFANLIKEQYIKNNSHETIYFTKSLDEYVELSKKADKSFFANLTQGDYKQFMPNNAKWFSVVNEVCEYAKQGIYFKWEKTKNPESVTLAKKYVAIHLRNIKNEQAKNIQIYKIYQLINYLYLKYNFTQFCFVGNDEITDGLKVSDFERIFSHIHFIDLRNQLELDEIAYVLKYSSIFIGRDSGIAHLGAAVGAKKKLVFDYENEKYFIKSPYNKICLMKKDSTIENLIVSLKELI